MAGNGDDDYSAVTKEWLIETYNKLMYDWKFSDNTFKLMDRIYDYVKKEYNYEIKLF